MSWYVKYLGIPFELDKSSMKSCDCAGLIFLVLEKELGAKIERAENVRCDARQKHLLMKQYFNLLEEIPQAEIQPLDIFFSTGIPWHTGVVVDAKKVLEATMNVGVKLRDINTLPQGITKFYRVRHEHRT